MALWYLQPFLGNILKRGIWPLYLYLKVHFFFHMSLCFYYFSHSCFIFRQSAAFSRLVGFDTSFSDGKMCFFGTTTQIQNPTGLELPEMLFFMFVFLSSAGDSGCWATSSTLSSDAVSILSPVYNHRRHNQSWQCGLYCVSYFHSFLVSWTIVWYFTLFILIYVHYATVWLLLRVTYLCSWLFLV